MIRDYIASIQEMQSQLFGALAIAACGANFCGILLNAFLHGNALPTRVCIYCGIVIVAFCALGMLTKYKSAASVGILVSVVWLEFPFLYSFYGNVILVYFVLSILGIIVFFPRKFGLVFCSITIVWDVIVILMIHMNGAEEVQISDVNRLLFTVCSYLIVALASLFVLNVLIMRYEKQKTELQEKNHELDYVATHDPLTKLYNRGYLIEELEKRIRENEVHFICAILDLDDFKEINDTYGHLFGDKVLVKFADLIRTEMDGKGFAARFGGEEFMLIYDGDDKEKVIDILKHVGEELKEYYMKEKELSVTFSGGLEVYHCEQKLDDIISNVDNKLYEAKRNGKCQVIC